MMAAYTSLFDPTAVAGTPEPFTLAAFTGTAPYQVNNVLSPGTGPGGQIGYVADFKFDQAYQYYSFGSSTAARSDNPDQEISAVGSLDSTHMPEPGTYWMMFIGAGLIGVRLARGHFLPGNYRR